MSQQLFDQIFIATYRSTSECVDKIRKNNRPCFYNVPIQHTVSDKLSDHQRNSDSDLFFIFLMVSTVHGQDKVVLKEKNLNGM